VSVDLVIDCGSLIDGLATEPLADARLHVSGDRIAAVGTQEDLTIPDNATHLNHSDTVVTPGLIDAHVHLGGERSMDPLERFIERSDIALSTARATSDLRKLVAAGFTSVRDMGSVTGLGLRAAQSAEEIPGPRIFTSGQSLSQTAGHGDMADLPHNWVNDDTVMMRDVVVDGVGECRAEARKKLREDVDFVKIMGSGGIMSRDSPKEPQFTAQEITAIADEAHRVGKPVSAHALGAKGITRCLENGVDTIEHAFYIDDASLDLLLETDAVLVPTFAIVHRVVEHGEEYGVPEYAMEKIARVYDSHIESIRTAYESGVTIAMGTDFLGTELLPHGENSVETEILTNVVGMAPMDVIKSATSVAAEAIGTNEIGRVEAGAYADIACFNENPLEDPGVLDNPVAVYQGGNRIDI